MAYDFDVFLSHAREDKDACVVPLLDALRACGLKVWYDDDEILAGDVPREKMKEGLRRARFGVVVLSPHYKKYWPQQELGALLDQERQSGETRIIPVLYRLDPEDLIRKWPFVAQKASLDFAEGAVAVAKKILRSVSIRYRADSSAEVVGTTDGIPITPGALTSDVEAVERQTVERGTGPAVVLSFSEKDRVWKDQLAEHLWALERQGLLSFWDSDRLGTGDDRGAAFSRGYAHAQIVVLLISPHFLGSKSIFETELPLMQAGQRDRGLRLFPLLVEPSNWRLIPWLADLTPRPRNGTALASLADPEVKLELAEFASEIQRALERSGKAEVKTVFLAEDHVLVREGIKQYLSKLPQFEVVGEAENSADAIKGVLSLKPDVALIDLNMPGVGGLEVVRHLSERVETRMLVVSGLNEEHWAVRCFRAGARGYLHKRSASRELVEAIETVLSGGTFLSQEAASALVSAATESGQQPHYSVLSDREMEVLLKTAHGASISEITSELNISVETLATYRRRIAEKLDIHSAADMVRYALSRNLIS
ncbi:MAG: TIR domain-containing protein [Acidobacteriota bacterium]